MNWLNIRSAAHDRTAQRPGLSSCRAHPRRQPWIGLSGLLAITLVAPLPLSAGESQSPVSLPLTDQFISPTLDRAWTAHVARTNRLEINDGTLAFLACGTDAHVERPLHIDRFRATCDLRTTAPDGLVSMALSWDAANLVQVGLNRRGAGRIEAREVLGTYAQDYDLGPWPAGQWCSVGLELADDCIRYFVRNGKSWKCLHVSPRPPRFAAPPALLILGQDADAKLFPPPSPWIASPTSATNRCQLRGVRLTALPPKAAQASAAERHIIERAGHDLFGEAELASREDPTFETVSRHYPAMKWAREIVGVKDHPFDIGVAADGSLQFSTNIARPGQPTACFRIDGCRFGSGPGLCAKRLKAGYLPIVIATDTHDGLQFEQTVFAYSKDFSPTEPLSAYVRLQVANPGNVPRQVRLALELQPAAPARAIPVQTELDVPARATKAVEVRLPYAILESAPSLVSSAEFDQRLAETTGWWDRLLAEGSRFEIPEPRVQNACRAWIAYSFLNVSKRKDVYHVCDGSGFYGEVYGYSAALYSHALDLLGYHTLAATYGDSLLTFMQTNGLLAVNFGDTDTGAALWAIGEHYRLTRDGSYLRRMTPQVKALSGWILHQRRQAQAQPGLAKGLIRYRPYADLLHPAADYFSNGYLSTGLASAAALLAEAGETAEAARLQRECDAYRRDILASMDAAVFTDRGMRILPAIPDTRELWKESDNSANGYYGIIAPCMLEAGIPAWNDPKAALLVDALQRRGGLTVGICQFHGLADHAYTYGYWMNCLQRDEVKRAILGLYGSLAYGMSRDTFAAVECSAIRTGENYWTLPHTYSNSQQLRLLRHLLVREEGTRLLLAQAVPRAWLSPGKRVAVNRAPTAFGPVSFSLAPATDRLIRVHLEPPQRSAPDQIEIRLRNPRHLQIHGVQTRGNALVTFSGESLRVQPAAEAIDMEVALH